MGYIYKITNNITNKCYIGKTERTIQERWKEHKKNISLYKDRLPLYRALNKYGVDNFTIEEIEQCDNYEIDDREIYWIAHFGTYKNGYNCTGGGEGGIRDYHECIDEIIKRYKAGERLDKLCKEFHCNYNSLRPKLIAKGVNIDTHAGPKKLSKSIYMIHPETKKIIKEYSSISAAARDICPEGRNYRAIANHISKYKNTKTVSHGYLWKTEDEYYD